MLAGVTTPRELIQAAAATFEAAGLHYGHGTDNAYDEAAFLVLHALGVGHEPDEHALRAELSERETASARALVERRITSRQPAAYLTHRMWFAGHEFYVDDRVLVPRSPIAELIDERFQPWLGGTRVGRILDIGTGSGCIAIACALAFPDARVEATDLSPDALAVAAINRRRHGLSARVRLERADLFPRAPRRYQLIVSNPPYVPEPALASLPAEYRHEPRAGFAAGEDGCACVTRILARAADHLTEDGVLVVEVGDIRGELERRFPRLPFTWIEFERGGEGVFALTRAQLAGR